MEMSHWGSREFHDQVGARHTCLTRPSCLVCDNGCCPRTAGCKCVCLLLILAMRTCACETGGRMATTIATWTTNRRGQASMCRRCATRAAFRPSTSAQRTLASECHGR